MKKSVSLILSLVLLHAFSLASLATDSSLEKSKRALLASRVKAGVTQLGTGKNAIVRVVLHDKTKYHGYITEIGDDGFVVADAKTGATAPIAYPEVKGIKGNNFSTGAKIGLGLAIAAVVVAIIVAKTSDSKEPDQPSCVQPAQVGVPCPPGCVCIQ
jgi:hypothetical protein